MAVWTEHFLPTADGQLLWAEAGAGPVILFLHGGPGDEYRYLKVLAEPLTDRYRCILFDQRGSGGSTLQVVDRETVHPDRFVADIEALRGEIGAETITLLGHSWGGILALLYGVAFPQRVGKAVLVGLGPLNQEMEAVARVNRMKVLTAAERARHAELTAARREAVAAGDRERVTAINRERFALNARAGMVDPTRLEASIEEWIAADRYRNWAVNPLVLAQIDREGLWAGLPRLAAPVLVLYGYQDFEPITQAYMLRERMAHVLIAFINEAGHVPWVEQPDAVQREIRAFLEAFSER